MDEPELDEMKLPELLSDRMAGIVPFAKYAFVSGVAWFVDMSLLYSLTEWLHLNYLVSASISFCCGLIVNYILCLRYVFGNSRFKRSKEFMLYTFIGLGGLIINDLIIYILVGWSMWYMMAKIIATGIGFIFNFLCRRSLFN